MAVIPVIEVGDLVITQAHLEGLPGPVILKQQGDGLPMTVRLWVRFIRCEDFRFSWGCFRDASAS